MSQVCTRYAPSPTGIPHIGNIRTALFSFLFAKNQKGKFILRIEDTDQKRSTHEHIAKIEQSLKSLNLDWDKKYLQSKRLNIYNHHLRILDQKGTLYQEKGAWYFKIQTKDNHIGWEDLVHGNVSFPAKVIEDFVIVKSDGFPTYHFASVVDDHLMNVSHVMRGDEWISSTPKHLLLYEAFGWQPPYFAHLPPILGQNHKKLSKREGAKSTLEYLEEGYLPEALVNFLTLLGWAPSPSEALVEGGKREREIFSLEELTRIFSIDRINKNSPIFNIEKLNWFNGQWIRKLDKDELTRRLNQIYPNYNVQKIKDLVPIVQDRLGNLKDFEKLAGPLIEEKVNVDPNNVVLSGDKLKKFVEEYASISPANWTKANISGATVSVMGKEKLNKPDAYGSIGIAVSGSNVTPPIFDMLEKLGKTRTIERLENVISEKKN